MPLPQGCYLCIINTKHAHFFEFSFKSVIFFIFIFSVSFLDVSQNCKHAFSDRLSFLILFCEEFPPCFLQLLHSSIGDEIKRYYFLPLLNLPSSRDLQDTFHYVVFFFSKLPSDFASKLSKFRSHKIKS